MTKLTDNELKWIVTIVDHTTYVVAEIFIAKTNYVKVRYSATIRTFAWQTVMPIAQIRGQTVVVACAGMT